MAQKLAIIDRITELADIMSKRRFSQDELFSYIKDHPRTIITRDRRTAKKSKDRLVFFNTTKRGDGSAVVKHRITHVLDDLLKAGKIFVNAQKEYSLSEMDQTNAMPELKETPMTKVSGPSDVFGEVSSDSKAHKKHRDAHIRPRKVARGGPIPGLQGVKRTRDDETFLYGDNAKREIQKATIAAFAEHTPAAARASVITSLRNVTVEINAIQENLQKEYEVLNTICKANPRKDQSYNLQNLIGASPRPRSLPSNGGSAICETNVPELSSHSSQLTYMSDRNNLFMISLRQQLHPPTFLRLPVTSSAS